MASDGTTSGPIRFSTPKLYKIGGFYTFPQKCLQGFSQGPFCEFPPVYSTHLFCNDRILSVVWLLWSIFCMVCCAVVIILIQIYMERICSTVTFGRLAISCWCGSQQWRRLAVMLTVTCRCLIPPSMTSALRISVALWLALSSVSPYLCVLVSIASRISVKLGCQSPMEWTRHHCRSPATVIETL